MGDFLLELWALHEIFGDDSSSGGGGGGNDGGDGDGSGCGCLIFLVIAALLFFGW